MKNMVCNLQKITICLFVILFSSAQAQTDPIASNEIREIAWSPLGDRIAVAYQNGLIQVIDSLDQTIHFETQTESRISNFAWSPNGQQLAASTLSPENALKIWDITTGELTFEYRDVGEDVIGVGWSPDNQQILASAAESLNGYNGILVNPTTLETTRLKLPLAVDITWSMNGKQIAFVGITWLLVLQRDDFSPIFTTQVETRNNINLQSQLVKVAWHPLQPEITAATGDGRAFVWQLGDPQPRLSLTTHDYTGQEFLLGWVYQLRYSATGETLTSIAGDGTIRTWNTTDGALLSEQRVSPNFGADFSPTGARVAVALAPSARATLNADQLPIEITVLDPTLTGLQALAAQCNLTTDLILQVATFDPVGFTTEVEALSEDVLPMGCQADLIAMAEAIEP